MAKRILVTGGAGFIGGNFTEYLVNNYPDYNVTVYDKFTYAGNKRNLPSAVILGGSKYKLVKGCVTDREKIKDLILESDIVVHFASESHVSNSLAQADEFVMTNIFGTMILCEEIVKYPVEKFILISSSEVYGTALTKPMDENHPINPASPYAGSKAGQDRIAYSYHYSFKNFPLIIIRPFNQFGPKQHIEKVIPRFITNIMNGKKIYIENGGKQTRDWLFVDDLNRAVLKAVEDDSGKLFGEVINVGSGAEISVLKVAEKIAQIMKVDPKKYFDFGKERKGQVMSHISSTEKALRLLNWRPEIGFDDGIKKTVDWYLNNKEWIKYLKYPVLKIAEMGEY